MRIKTSDIWSSSFWLVLSIFICIEAYILDIGNFHNPGAGFMPFWTGLVIGIFSLMLLIMTLIKKEGGGNGGVLERIKWKNIILVVISMYIYAIIFEKLGYVITTLIFIGILLRIIENKKWYIAAIVALTAALASYLVFQIWLKTQLPKGILRI